MSDSLVFLEAHVHAWLCVMVMAALPYLTCMSLLSVYVCARAGNYACAHMFVCACLRACAGVQIEQLFGAITPLLRDREGSAPASDEEGRELPPPHGFREEQQLVAKVSERVNECMRVSERESV